jgi:hypothetical protein
MVRCLGFLVVMVCFFLTACPNAPVSEKKEEAGVEVKQEVAGEAVIGDGAEESSREALAEESAPELPLEAMPEQPIERNASLPILQAPTISTPVSAPSIVQIQPSLGVSSEGRLAMSYTASAGDNLLGIFFVQLDAEGKAAQPHIRLDTFSGGNKTESSLCALRGGGYVVVWSMDTGSFDPEEGNLQIRFRLVDASGQAVGSSDTQVKTKEKGNHWLARVVCTAEGGFAIAGVYPDDGLSFGVFVQRFDAQGKTVGEALGLNTVTAGNQAYPDIAAASDGTLVVAWEQGEDGKEAAFRVISPDNTKRSDVFLTFATDTDARPAVAIDPTNDDIVLATRRGGRAYRLSRYTKEGKNPRTLAFPDTATTSFAQPVLLALGIDDAIAALYLKGANNNAASPTLAILGGAAVEQSAFSITTGRIPLPYRPSLAFHNGIFWAAYTERTEVTNGLTIKIARFK